MSELSLKLLVEGGKATTNQQMAQTLAPQKIDMKAVCDKINELTSDMGGMEVPVEIIADTETKEFEIKVGKNRKKAIGCCFKNWHPSHQVQLDLQRVDHSK